MLDPIQKRQTKYAFQIEKRGDGQKINKHVYIEEAAKRHRAFYWFHFVLIFFGVIIVSALFWGGLFLFGLAKAKNQTITKNFSGGAPALNPEVSLPVINENDTKNDFVNILLLGNGGAGHSGGALCDVIQVLSINVKTKKSFMVSIPRDLFVDIDGSQYKINEMYFRGEAKGKGVGGGTSKKIAGEVLGIPIHYYLKIDFTGFKRIVDTLDGIDVYVDKGISDPVWGYYIKAGEHHFNGAAALDYVRSRESTSDFDRSARQQKTLVAMRDKAIKLNILSDADKIIDIINTTSNNLRTDITPQESYKLLSMVKDIPWENMSSYVFDTGADNFLYSTITRGGAYGIFPVGGNYDKIHEFVKLKMP